MQTVFAIDNGAVAVTEHDVLGVVSLIFWTITLIVSIKYVAFVMRADNHGEGGILALAVLVQRSRVARAGGLVVLGILGASLFYGDSAITPAISVLSAVEGLDVSTPSISHLVVPIALAILTALFAIQRWGTHAVGRAFGPIMALWFTAIGAAGLAEVVARPDVVEGLLPTYAAGFVLSDPGVAFVALGAVVLAVTGAEALYADMGHFGRGPIRRAWFALVFPALTLNYLGQAGLILHDPGTAERSFYLLVPHWARLPMVVLATAATVIASQAVISGAFSLSRQGVQLGFLPPLTVRHTSPREVGQVYVPAVNWVLFAAVVVIVLGFRSSERLAAAYGVAVSGTFVITTILFLALARGSWRWPVWRVAFAGAVFLPIEGAFFAANLGKIPHGGWLPVVAAAGVFLVMTTWHRGRAIVTENRTRAEGPLRAFVGELRAKDPPLPRVPGTGVFLSRSVDTTPLALRANVEHNHVLHERVVIVTAESLDIPRVRDGRVRVDDLGYTDDNITFVMARFGYLDRPSIPDALRLARAQGLECDIDLEHPSYFLSRIALEITDAPGLNRWRKHLFVIMARNAASPVAYFELPDERAIEIGSIIPV